jgi:hypothetical protein
MHEYCFLACLPVLWRNVLLQSSDMQRVNQARKVGAPDLAYPSIWKLEAASSSNLLIMIYLATQDHISDYSNFKVTATITLLVQWITYDAFSTAHYISLNGRMITGKGYIKSCLKLLRTRAINSVACRPVTMQRPCNKQL